MNKLSERSPRILKETSRGLEQCALEDELYRKRKIFLTAGIDADSANELLKQLMYLEEESEVDEITLYINSPGGEVISGLAVYDYMRMMKVPVRTVCIGTAASMGSVLFLAGDKREMLPHTKIMIHDPSFHGGFPSGEKPLDLQKKVNDIMRTRDDLCSIIAERTGRNIEEVFEKTKEDSYFTAEEAMEFGLATAIINSA